MSALLKLVSRKSSNTGSEPISDEVPNAHNDTLKQHVLGRLFSSDSPARNKQKSNAENEMLLQKRSSLVPPNYQPIFRQRQFPLQTNWSSSQWAEELISLPDNAVRKELTDMYSIFDSMDNMPLMLTIQEIDLFKEWFRTFEVILQNLFDLEEQSLYEWIEGTDKMSAEEKKWDSPPAKITGELSEGKRLRKKGEIIQQASEIGAICSNFQGRPILQGLPDLAKCIHPFVEHLLDYMELKQRLLPGYIYKQLRRKERARYERRFWSCLLRYEQCAETVAAVTTWMERATKRKLKVKWLGGIRGSFAWERLFFEKHQICVVEFAQRVAESQLEREKQMEMNEIARARVRQLSVSLAIDGSTSGETSASTCVDSTHQVRSPRGVAAFDGV